MKKEKNKRYITIFLLMIFLTMMGITFVNQKVDAAGNYKYLIKVNKQQNCVTIYEKDENGEYTVPVKAMVCSTGWATPLGTYNTKTKYRWKLLLEDVWGQYSTRITGSILFHSVWYYKQDPSTLSATEYNKLGTTCSHGCIRLTVEDAKWIYDNCPIGTTVTIYNAKDPGPLGKPKAEKLKSGTKWDPTDPNEDNPLLKNKFRIIGANDVSIQWGSEFDALKGVTATSAKGTDLTDKIEVTGTVDTKTSGEYKLTYSVLDEEGNETSKTIQVLVGKSPDILRLTGVGDRSIVPTTVVNRKQCLKGVKAYLGEKKLSSSLIDVQIETLENEYVVTYTLILKNGDSVTEKATFYVDYTPPVLEVEHVIYSTKTEVNDEFVLQYVKVSDDYSPLSVEDIEVNIEQIFKRGHLVTFTVSDFAGNTTTETVQFTRTDSVNILGVKNHLVPEGTIVDDNYVMEGVTGDDAGKDATKNIKVTISKPENGVYTVTYELINRYDVYTKIIAYFTQEG